FPRMSGVSRTALSTKNFGGKWITFTSISISLQPMLLYKFLSAGKFQLDCIPRFFIDNTDMATFHINLRNLSMIFHLLFGKEIGSIGFLQQGISHMLFIF